MVEDINNCTPEEIAEGRKKDNSAKSSSVRRKTDATATGYDCTKSSKSVTFTGPESQPVPDQIPDQKTQGVSISTCGPMTEHGSAPPKAYDSYPEDGDLWLAFLTETGLLQLSDTGEGFEQLRRRDPKIDSPESILQELNYYQKTGAETASTTLRDDYETLHRMCPGLFHDTIPMDDAKEAFRKAKRIIRDIVNSQSSLSPMFDIDFANNLHYYPTVEQRLEDIRKEIAPHQIFY